MKIKERIVVEYISPTGKNVFRRWLNSIKDKKTQAVIDSRILRLRSGNLGVFKNLGKGLKELKIDYGAGYRIYFAEEGEDVVVLLAAGDKKSQGGDIKQAYENWKNYQEIEES